MKISHDVVCVVSNTPVFVTDIDAVVKALRTLATAPLWGVVEANYSAVSSSFSSLVRLTADFSLLPMSS